MNNNNLFNLLAGLAKAMNESSKYQQLDFTKKEDIDKLDNAIKILKENEFFSNLFGKDMFDGIQEKAHKIYNESVEEKKRKEEEERRKKYPIRPQLTVSENIKNNITNLACEYLNTMILPYANLKEKQVEDILNGLIDFGCWVYNK